MYKTFDLYIQNYYYKIYVFKIELRNFETVIVRFELLSNMYLSAFILLEDWLRLEWKSARASLLQVRIRMTWRCCT